MGFKPEDVRIPYDWYYYGEEPREEPEPLPKAYDQAYVDNLKGEIEYWKKRYMELRWQKTSTKSV